ncbi:hypothetical protein Lal_00025569 [Lupinus albus]|nr:hypothetical protein Lal_00025569 [Lupinus albus]
MAENRTKRLKTTATHPRRNFEVWGSSSATVGRTTAKRDLFFSPTLQAIRLERFQGRKLAYVACKSERILLEEVLAEKLHFFVNVL